jgi:preprotein translocase subunit SecE
MARDRQRAKQRQQQRREERLAQLGESGGAAAGEPRDPATPREPRQPVPPTDGNGAGDGRRDAEIEDRADLEVGAPPEDLGFSERTIRDEHEPPAPDFDTDDEALIEDDDGSGSETDVKGPRGVRGGGGHAEAHERGRLVGFLVAVWAELQRVQWPDRRQLTQLTGVVLFFVVIVGIYLGALDWVFSNLVKALL